MRRLDIPHVERVAIFGAIALAVLALILANALGGWWYSHFWVWMAPVTLAYWVMWRLWANRQEGDNRDRP